MAEKIVQLKIEKLNLGAQGIGFLDGKVCFVDFVIPGEEIEANIIIEKKDYNVAKCIKILKPSPARIEPRCPVFGTCGGCQFQHIDYHTQVELKRDILKDTLKHIGKIEFDAIESVYGIPYHYRNRAQLPVQQNNGLKIGYFKRSTHEVINHDICYINQPEINQLLSAMKERIKKSKIKIYDEIKHQGNLRHIIIRRGTNTGQIYITLVTKERSLPEIIYDGLMAEIPEVVGINQNINDKRTNRILGSKNVILAGRNFYEEMLDGKIFQIDPASFFQVNISVFEKIIEKIKNEIQGPKVIDLYAGVGAIGICVAHLCKNLIAIEENSDSVKHGMKNALLNNIDNIKFITGRVENRINAIKKCDTLILDPPRKGIGLRITREITILPIRKIIYLSCNPATLARDASLIIKSGFRIKRIYFFDMFAQTYHIETLVIFEK
ncbi:MAG: 23S rRNA (uracil(1939)-C(5))-methyltransferase RlmD [bacterium]